MVALDAGTSERGMPEQPRRGYMTVLTTSTTSVRFLQIFHFVRIFQKAPSSKNFTTSGDFRFLQIFNG